MGDKDLKLKAIGTIKALHQRGVFEPLYTEKGEPLFSIGRHNGKYEIWLRDVNTEPIVVKANYMLYVNDTEGGASA